MNLSTEISNGHVLLAQRLPGVRKFMLIGSASYIPEQAKDVDFAVLLDDGLNAMEFTSRMNATDKWELCGEYDLDKGTWAAVRKGKLNLMITHDRVFYERFLAATEVCKALHLTDKEDRIAVCKIVRDGMTAGEAKAWQDHQNKTRPATPEKDDEL